jgi:CubicO group peptidase (beta-lactamase class C family)
MMRDFDTARKVLREATEIAFPAAVVEVGCHDRALWQEAFGALTRDAGSPPTSLETLFDLASLTKVLSTTTLAMAAVDGQCLQLTDPVRRWLPEWRGDDRKTVTVEDLLSHASGLTAYLPYFRDHQGRDEFERAICTMPLECRPRETSIYSDLGFILLGFILADAVGAPIDSQFEQIAEREEWGEIIFRPASDLRACAAPTEVDSWRGRLLVGEVHDENAWALGGVAGHAGLFGTAPAVGRFARTVLRQYRDEAPLAHSSTFERFIKRSIVPKSSRALGWDTMLPTSSCGRRMSGAAIGHTGFTGTSLWIDPSADTYAVLLTNRVHPSRDNDAILRVRPAFHDAVIAALS